MAKKAAKAKRETAAPVTAIVGEDAVLVADAMAEILQAIPGSADEVQRADVEGPKAGLADVLDELRSFAMFGGTKLVVVRDADDFISKYRQQLEDYVAAPSDSGYLVLRCKTLPGNQKITKLIAKHGEVIKCEPPKDRELPGWLRDRAKGRHGIDLDAGAAAMLAEVLGADLGRAENELAKLALRHEGKVTADDITNGVAFQRERQMWSMTDALSTGDREEAVRRWRQLLQSDPSSTFRAVTWIGIWLEKSAGGLMMRQRSRASDQAIAKALRIWPANNVGPMMRQAESLGLDGLRRATDALAELDRRIKTGLGDAESGVERFLLTLGQ